MLDVTLGQPRSRESLIVFPLVTADEAELPYDLLHDALAAGTLAITEVGEGAVPELLAKNAGDADVLILDGEQLVGAKQNRTTNRSILLPATSETRIPVSCMEQGRWRHATDSMTSAPQHSPAKVRRRAREVEAEYADAGMAAPQDALAHAQGRVWSAIAESSAKLGGRSATGALDDLYTVRTRELDEWSAEFPCVDDQVGLVAFLGDRALGMDVVGGRELYGRLHARLLRGYLLDALEGLGAASGTVDGPAAQGFLDRVRAAQRIESPTAGRGSYRVLSGGVIGGELVDDAGRDGDGVPRPVHLCAFPVDERPRENGTAASGERSIARPSERRRGRAPERER